MGLLPALQECERGDGDDQPVRPLQSRLKFKGVKDPLCNRRYHDHEQTPAGPGDSWEADGVCKKPCDCGRGVECGEYLWDHRNASLRKWLVEEYLAGPKGIGNPAISGVFIVRLSITAPLPCFLNWQLNHLRTG